MFKKLPVKGFCIWEKTLDYLTLGAFFTLCSCGHVSASILSPSQTLWTRRAGWPGSSTSTWAPPRTPLLCCSSSLTTATRWCHPPWLLPSHPSDYSHTDPTPHPSHPISFFSHSETRRTRQNVLNAANHCYCPVSAPAYSIQPPSITRNVSHGFPVGIDRTDLRNPTPSNGQGKMKGIRRWEERSSFKNAL